MKNNILIFIIILISGYCFAQDTPHLYKKAVDEYNQGNYIEADKLFEKIVKGYSLPDEINSTASYFSSDALLKLGEDDAAAQGLEFFINSYPWSGYRSKAIYVLGLIYYGKNEFAQSRSTFQKLLRDYPTSEYTGSALNWIGQSYLAENRPQDAIKFLNSAVTERANNKFIDQSLYVLASTYEKLGDYQNAVKNYDQLISYYKQSPFAHKAYVRIAECYIKLKDYQSAIVELNNPDLNSLPKNLYEECQYILANAYYRTKEFNKAETTFKKIILNFPGSKLDRGAKYGLGWIYFQTNRYDLAFNMFNSLASGSDSSAVKSSYWRAVVKKYAGDDTSAVRLFNDFINKYPNDELASSAKYQIGVLNYGESNMPESEKYLNQSINSSSDALKIKALTLKGEISLNQKNYKSAKENFLNAISITDVPEELDYRAQMGLGISLFYLDDYKNSISYLNQLSNKDPDFEKNKVNFYLGECYYAQHDYHDAVKYYNKVDPADKQVGGWALYGKAYCNFNLQQYSTSASLFREFVNRYPKDPRALDARMRLADSYYGSKDFAAASRVYKDIFNIDKNSLNDPYTYYQYAQALFKGGSRDEAITEFLNLQRRFPSSEYADKSLYVVGWIHFQQGGYEQAINSYKHVMQVYPSSNLGALIDYSIGDCYYNMNKYDSAIVSYKKVLTDYPNSNNVFDAIDGLQYTYVAQGHPEKAIDLINDYISKNPNKSFSDQIYYKKGDIYFNENKYQLAEKSYKEFIAEYPNSSFVSDAYYWIGKCAENLKQNPEALYNFRKVFNDYPKSESAPAAVLEMGNIYNNLTRYDSALAVYDTATTVLKNSKRLVDILFMKGITLSNKKDLQNAYSVFSEVMQNYPNTIFANKSKLEIGLIELAAKRYDNADNYFQDLAENRTDELGAEGQYYYGLSMMEQNKVDDAIDSFIKVRNFFPGYDEWVTNAYLKLGDCYTQKKEIAKAKDVYRDVLARHRGDQYGNEAQKKLRELQ